MSETASPKRSAHFEVVAVARVGGVGVVVGVVLAVVNVIVIVVAVGADVVVVGGGVVLEVSRSSVS